MLLSRRCSSFFSCSSTASLKLSPTLEARASIRISGLVRTVRCLRTPPDIVFIVPGLEERMEGAIRW